MSNHTHRTYLGDGVYVQAIHGEVVLTTSNGREDTNVIHMEPYVVERFRQFIGQLPWKGETR